ncbi:MAG: tetratricopeptide repeat protein [Halobacteriovoraceae bacterium]|nr:tetratricopeptide repeat protein [Halobacteriovoraceae bacterium]
MIIKIIFLILLSSCDFTPRIHKEILKAQEHILNKEYVEAVNLYENILEKRPANQIQMKVHFQLAELYSIYINEQEKAKKHYSKIKEMTNDPLWLVKSEEKIAEINFSYLKNYSAAVENYTLLYNFVPKLNKVDFYQERLGEAYLKLENYVKAIEVFFLLTKNKDRQFQAKGYFNLGMCYFEQKQWRKAIAHWKEYIKHETRKDHIIQVKFLMANTYETMERLKQAYDLYYSLLGEYPNTQVIKNRLNSIYERRVARRR